LVKRQFRTDESLKAEEATRKAVVPLLVQHGFVVDADDCTSRGSAISQVVSARLGGKPIKMHVRLCWRRDGGTVRERSYSAAQLRARLIEDDWDATLAQIADRERSDGNSHNLIVQNDEAGFAFAALVPSDQLPAIWRRQRDISADLIAAGQMGSVRKNHAQNGASPTIWLQDDRTSAAHAVADALWTWPGVLNILALPREGAEHLTPDDTFDDIPFDYRHFGRDMGTRITQVRSGYPRDPKVRAAVLNRAGNQCEREGCGQNRNFTAFLDVHHILGIWSSDRVWSCVALCPNCHREAHFAPDREAINKALGVFAAQFKEAS
jgi:5-methylcytosine-specific restriction protein A